MTYLQAYYLTWMIPTYTKVTAVMPAVAAAAKKAFDPTEGGVYLFIAVAVVIILTISAKVAGKGRSSLTKQ